MEINLSYQLIVEDKLTNKDKDLMIQIETSDDLAYTYINEQEALALVRHLIKVFHVSESTIEVIHFPTEVNRADVLRTAANRLDAGEVFDGSY